MIALRIKPVAKLRAALVQKPGEKRVSALVQVDVGTVPVAERVLDRKLDRMAAEGLFELVLVLLRDPPSSTAL